MARAMKRLLQSACVLALAGSAAAPASAAKQGEKTEEQLQDEAAQVQLLGKPAPAFELTTVDGETVSLDALKGSPVVVMFGATWCPYSNQMAPALQGLEERYRDRGVKVLLVDIKEKKRKVAKHWPKKRGLKTVPLLLDAEGEVSSRYAPQGVKMDIEPYYRMVSSVLLIDPAGVVRFVNTFVHDAFDPKLTALEARLEELLAKK